MHAGSLADILSELKSKKTLCLREDGADIHSQADRLSEDRVFLLGNHLGMTLEEEASVKQAGAEMVSTGPASLHADHCIVLLSWMPDVRIIGDLTSWHGPAIG
jgi:tRNA (pseudouridine54-N1)-methyltransferase